jgi:hypothetical protein
MALPSRHLRPSGPFRTCDSSSSAPPHRVRFCAHEHRQVKSDRILPISNPAAESKYEYGGAAYVGVEGVLGVA